jgi:hypothetical protein
MYSRFIRAQGECRNRLSIAVNCAALPAVLCRYIPVAGAEMSALRPAGPSV